MTNFEEIANVWRGETVRAARSGRVVVLLLLFMMFVGLSLAVVGFFSSQITSRAEEAAKANGVNLDDPKIKEQFNNGKKQLLSVFITDDEEMLDSLLTLPLILLIVFKLMLRFVPLLIVLMGYDQLSGEIGPKSIRFLLVRLKRDNLILGKFASQVTIFAALLCVCTVLMVIVARLLNHDFAAQDVLVWTLRLLVASFVLAVAYLALTTLCSALVRMSALSAILNIIVLFAIWSVAFFGEIARLPGELVDNSATALARPESVLGYARYLSVWHFGQDLLHPDWVRFLTAVVAHLGFALVFLGLAQLVMKRRDL